MKTNWYSMVSQIQAHRNDPKPLEYILGGSFFCGEWFIVTPDVLIPRIETETLVNYVLSKSAIRPDVTSGQFEIRILDLGTGSGNIAIILAKKLGYKVYAVDVSEGALGVARKNAKMHGVEDLVEFYKSDWFDELKIEPVDLIASNPPYISEEEWNSLSGDVKDYEPRVALWGGKEGLEHYKKIISGARNMLVPDGRIVMEIGHNQAEYVKRLLQGFRDIEVIYDNFGNSRIISANLTKQVRLKV